MRDYYDILPRSSAEIKPSTKKSMFYFTVTCRKNKRQQTIFYYFTDQIGSMQYDLYFTYFFCFAWQISPSLSACAQAAVSVSFGSLNASFLHVKEATERQIILPRMRKNSPFRCQKSKNFLGRGHSPLPTPHPARRLRRLDPPICAMTNITYFRPWSSERSFKR